MVLEYSELSVCVDRMRGWSWSTVSSVCVCVGRRGGVVLEYSELSVCVGMRRGWSWSTVSSVCVLAGGGGPGVQ